MRHTLKALFYILFFVYSACTTAIATTTVIEKNDISKVKILEPWARESLGAGSNSAVYMVIKNDSDADIELVNVSSLAAANKVELHRSYIDNEGVGRMTSVDKMVIPAGSTIELKPGGAHIMLFDLKKPLRAGDTFPILLEFSNTPSQEIVVTVRARG